MKIQDLKQRTWEAWAELNTWQGDLLLPGIYVEEIRRIGDRRCKATWRKALARFEAMLIHQSCLDAWSLIRYSFNFTPDRWDYELRYEILDEFLSYSNGAELIKMGLEQLLSKNFTTQERKAADGFFRLVEGQQGRRISLPVGLA